MCLWSAAPPTEENSGDLLLIKSVLKLASKYQSKKKLDSGNVVYEYTEKQVQYRNNQKAKRIQALTGKIDKVREKVKKGLASKDMKEKLTALAVGLIDHVFERVGNEESAKDGHVGVTGFEKRHITMGKDSATIRYVGKSGVKHEKKVTDKGLLKVLREVLSEIEGDEGGVFTVGDTTVGASDVNEFLREFDITAKDIRGMHANEEVRKRLESLRSKGPELPRDKTKKEEILKKEFLQAIEEVADIIGHTPAVLRKQYLAPSVEKAYMHDGTIVEKFDEKVKVGGAYDKKDRPLAFSERIIRQFIDHSFGVEKSRSKQDIQVMRVVFRKEGGSWEKLMRGDQAQLKLLSSIVVAWGKNSTKE